MDDLYHQEILELYKNPTNFGELSEYDLTHHESNSSCGDAFTFYLKVSDDKKHLEDVSFTGEGCVISTAACSLLCNHVKGQNINDINTLDIDDMIKLIGTPVTAMRIKCLTLPLKGLHSALAK